MKKRKKYFDECECGRNNGFFPACAIGFLVGGIVSIIAALVAA